MASKRGASGSIDHYLFHRHNRRTSLSLACYHIFHASLKLYIDRRVGTLDLTLPHKPARAANYFRPIVIQSRALPAMAVAILRFLRVKCVIIWYVISSLRLAEHHAAFNRANICWPKPAEIMMSLPHMKIADDTVDISRALNRHNASSSLRDMTGDGKLPERSIWPCRAYQHYFNKLICRLREIKLLLVRVIARNPRRITNKIYAEDFC